MQVSVMALTFPQVFYVLSVGFWSLVLEVGVITFSVLYLLTSTQLLRSIKALSIFGKAHQKLRERFRAWKFLTHGPEHIREGYTKVHIYPHLRTWRC